MNRKIERIESEILNILNHTLIHDIYDEYIKKVSFTAVHLTSDLSTAYVYVDTYDRSEIDQKIDKLMIAKSVFKNAMAKAMQIRKIPDLKFLKDETIDNSLKIDKILDKIK
ncbi:MAG: 30S ribosome-binding factor RbfA [Mycoplasmataceae bacterium]|jgi:ribosome-binding factor A|nr:30S ribosome-binding factor RbfA [Mycoplasmataceae bacterium]